MDIVHISWYFPNRANRMSKSQSETIAELNARCDGPNQFENFDRAFRKLADRIENSSLEGRGAVEASTQPKEAGEG